MVHTGYFLTNEQKSRKASTRSYEQVKVDVAYSNTNVITGKSNAVFDYYGLNTEGSVQKAIENLG